jgi:pimeloyl-ACP methyl ester carboxylesterase
MLAADGYEVLVVDRPGHGRSPYHPDLLGPMTPPPTYEILESIFSPGADSPLGTGHTEWPADRGTAGELIDLDRIGPAIVLTHSAGGPAGFLVADARPDKVPITVVSTAHSKLGAAGAETVAFLRSVGCEVEELKLAEHGFAGDGHGVMLRRNNAEVLEFLLGRLRLRSPA